MPVHFLNFGGSLSAYAQTVLAKSPLGFWQLNESSGTTADDLTANASDMTLVNTPTLGVAGPSSQIPLGMGFDAASSERATSGDLALFNVAASSSWSLECWLKYSTVGTTTQVPLMWRINSNSVPGTTGLLSVNSGLSGRIRGFAPNSAGSGFITIDSDGSWNNNAWHHVVLRSLSGGDLELVIDNVERVSSSSARSTSTTGNRRVQVAANESAANLFSGSVCAVAAYDQYLDDTEVAQNYNAGA